MFRLIEFIESKFLDHGGIILERYNKIELEKYPNYRK